MINITDALEEVVGFEPTMRVKNGKKNLAKAFDRSATPPRQGRRLSPLGKMSIHNPHQPMR